MSKKIKIIISAFLVLIFLMLIFNSSLGRYVYNSINNHILESQRFYFNSPILTMNGANYVATDWDGVNPYTLNISVNSKKNDLVYTDSDINYNIAVTCPSTVICTLNKNTGTILKTLKVDSYTITITPINNFYAGDEVAIETTATSTYPYEKTLSASYTVSVVNYGFTYSVTDQAGLKYATLKMVNAKPYYSVITAFGTYGVGDLVSINEYNALSSSDKANCRSMRATVSFDPNYVLLDVTNNVYQNRISQTTRWVNGKSYVSGFVTDMEALTTDIILFYKKDVSQDYSNANLITVQAH